MTATRRKPTRARALAAYPWIGALLGWVAGGAVAAGIASVVPLSDGAAVLMGLPCGAVGVMVGWIAWPVK